MTKEKKTLARLLRPMPPEFFPQPEIIATYDHIQEIVFFNKEVFETLDDRQRRQVYFLKSPYLELATTN